MEVGDLEDPVDTLLARRRGIGMHALFDGVCRPRCRFPHAKVFLVDHVDFPLHPESFRVATS